MDINCDLGEGFPNDEAIMSFITSSNIACGGHFGDANTMATAVLACLGHQVRVGAHPSYPDREGFGRQPMVLSDQALQDSLAGQILALKAIVEEAGATLHHVKPHGALYNQSADDAALADLVAQVVEQIDSSLILYGLPFSEHQRAAERRGLAFWAEGFVDRVYLDSGRLTPRDIPGAVLHNSDDALRQFQHLMQGFALTIEGRRIALPVQTICLHGDGPNALALARGIHLIRHATTDSQKPSI